MLTHRSISKEHNLGKGYREQRFGLTGSLGFSGQSASREQPNRSKVDPSSCHYSLEKGNWKKECPVLKEKVYRSKASVAKPVALTVSGAQAQTNVISKAEIRDGSKPEMVVASSDLSSLVSVGSSLDGCSSDSVGVPEHHYFPFITDGFVLLVGSSIKVPVKYLGIRGNLSLLF